MNCECIYYNEEASEADYKELARRIDNLGVELYATALSQITADTDVCDDYDGFGSRSVIPAGNAVLFVAGKYHNMSDFLFGGKRYCRWFPVDFSSFSFEDIHTFDSGDEIASDSDSSGLVRPACDGPFGPTTDESDYSDETKSLLEQYELSWQSDDPDHLVCEVNPAVCEVVEQLEIEDEENDCDDGVSAFLRTVLERYREAASPGSHCSAEVAEACNNLGSTLVYEHGRSSEAEGFHEVALGIYRQLSTEDSEYTGEVAFTLSQLAECVSHDRLRTSEEEAYLREAVDIQRDATPAYPYASWPDSRKAERLVLCCSNLAELLQKRSPVPHDEVEALYREALGAQRAVVDYGSSCSDQVSATPNSDLSLLVITCLAYAAALLKRGGKDEALPLIREAVEGCGRMVDTDWPSFQMPAIRRLIDRYYDPEEWEGAVSLDSGNASRRESSSIHNPEDIPYVPWHG